MKSDEIKPVHVLMRFANDFLSADDMIEAHQAVIKRKKSVWIGKVGKPLGNDKIAIVNLQLKAGMPSFLFLVQKVGAEYEAFRATIVELARTLPPGQESRVPKYYVKNDIAPKVAFWTRVSDIKKIPTKSLSDWHIVSSRRPVPNTLARSMAALFLISEGKGDTVYA